MELRGQIIEFLEKNQSKILEVLEYLRLSSAKERVKELLDKLLFDIHETSDNGEVLSIKIKKTGEILRKGDEFFHEEYKKKFICDHFDGSLFGHYYFNTFYQNYIRGKDGGLYHLGVIRLEEKVDPKCNNEENAKFKKGDEVRVTKECIENKVSYTAGRPVDRTDLPFNTYFEEDRIYTIEQTGMYGNGNIHILVNGSSQFVNEQYFEMVKPLQATEKGWVNIYVDSINKKITCSPQPFKTESEAIEAFNICAGVEKVGCFEIEYKNYNS